MAADNQVTLVGNLTDDPEPRFTPNGNAVANQAIATLPAPSADGGILPGSLVPDY